jgi:hypothetical protein
MIKERELRRAMRHGERELRAAGGDVLSQLNPRNIVRDARDLALKFKHDEGLQAYVASRIWVLVGLALGFMLVGTVCGIDVMFKVSRVNALLALPVGAAVWVGAVAGQMYAFAIWLEGRVALRARAERGIRVRMPAGFLAYLKYSRAAVSWILILVCVVLPLLSIAGHSPVAAMLLLLVAVLPPFLYIAYTSWRERRES